MSGNQAPWPPPRQQQQPQGPYQGPYQSQQPGWQQPQYAPGPQGPQGPQRRKRHPLRTALLTAGGIVVVIVVAAIAAAAGGGGHTVTGQAAGTAAASSPSRAAKAAAAAKIGSVITLTGNSSGEQVAVTVTKVFRHPQPATSSDDPDAGDRLYAVQFRLADTGSTAYSDAPSNGAAVTDSAGQSYQPSFDNAAECESFPGTENIAVGSSGLGCVVFEVPETARITEVQFTLDSGMGPQTGQWDVRS